MVNAQVNHKNHVKVRAMNNQVMNHKRAIYMWDNHHNQ